MKSNWTMYEERLENIRNEIKMVMKKEGLTQQKLAALCGANGVKASQTTISSILTGNKGVALETILQVCDLLEINAFDLETEAGLDYPKGYCETIGGMINALLECASQNLCTNPDDIFFNGVLGEYFCYFHSTNNNEKKIIEGQLTFEKKGEYCKATLTLGDKNIKKESYYKSYEGFLIMSPVQMAAYCLFVNPDMGEISYITFWHKPILNHGVELKCKMASAATISSGVNMRLSTVHRFFFSRRELSESEKELVSGQLRLNDSQILLTKSRYEEILDSKDISEEFKTRMQSVGKEETYYVMNEAALIPDGKSLERYFGELCLLREHSEAPTDNKVRINTDSAFYYNIIRNNKK